MGIDDEDAADHVRENACWIAGGLWLPAVCSEGDGELRAKLIAALGSPRSSGYMSEKCGWWLLVDGGHA